MLLKEFLELGKTCKVCGNTDPKGISVRTIWGDVQSVENKNGALTFKFMGVGESPQGERRERGCEAPFEHCYEIFKFKLDEHTATREIHNPGNISMMYHNNFVFKIACLKCSCYSFESS